MCGNALRASSAFILENLFHGSTKDFPITIEINSITYSIEYRSTEKRSPQKDLIHLDSDIHTFSTHFPIPTSKEVPLNFLHELNQKLLSCAIGEGAQYNFIHSGTPHFIIELSKNSPLQNIDIHSTSQWIRHHSSIKKIFPQGCNVTWVAPLIACENQCLIRTYEKGVERETSSCGTAVVAAFYHFYSQKKPSFFKTASFYFPKNNVQLFCKWLDEKSSTIELTGPAQKVFTLTL